MYISIDASKCMGHGRCYAVAPELLHDDDEGFVEERGQCWKVPESLEHEALEAVDACPEAAITVSADDPGGNA